MDARGLEEADWPGRVCERVEAGEAGGWWLEGWSIPYCSAWWREVRTNDRTGRHAGHSTLTTHPWGGWGGKGGEMVVDYEGEGERTKDRTGGLLSVMLWNPHPHTTDP